MVERTITLSDREVIEVIDLPPDFAVAEADSQETLMACPKLPEEGIDMPRLVSDIERGLIRSALELASGVKTRAADLLHIKRTTLVEKIKRLEIET